MLLCICEVPQVGTGKPWAGLNGTEMMRGTCNDGKNILVKISQLRHEVTNLRSYYTHTHTHTHTHIYIYISQANFSFKMVRLRVSVSMSPMQTFAQ
jgi:hypothetical protein